MNCHSQIFSTSPFLEPVRESFRSGRSIQWTRVHDLPDFVYFDHSIHIHKGVGCTTCHGQVDRMPLMYQEQSLQMEWCVDCHREPERYVRPREAVFRVDYDAAGQPARARRASRRPVSDSEAHELLDVPPMKRSRKFRVRRFDRFRVLANPGGTRRRSGVSRVPPQRVSLAAPGVGVDRRPGRSAAPS